MKLPVRFGSVQFQVRAVPVPPVPVPLIPVLPVSVLPVPIKKTKTNSKILMFGSKSCPNLAKIMPR